MCHTVNFYFTKLLDILLYPFHLAGEFAGVLILSILMSVVVLLVFKYTSSPEGIKRTKNQIKSNILAIRLYKDFWKVILSSFGKSLAFTGKYFLLIVYPLLIMTPILLPLFMQMDIRYGKRPFHPDETFVVKASFLEDPNSLNVSLEPDSTFSTTMNPVYINAFLDEEQTKSIREINWKLRANTEGFTRLSIRINDQTYQKDLYIGKFLKPLSNRKYARSSIGHILYPSEPLLASKKHLSAISVSYPGKLVSFFGFKAHWIIYNLIIVIILVLALRKKFNVEF
jgi:hypothetical protein